MIKKRIVFVCILTACLTGCAKYQMPPFGDESTWRLTGNTVSNTSDGLAVNFGGTSIMPIANASNGDYELNYIASDTAFANYDARCAAYMKDVLASIPLTIECINVMVADQYMILTTGRDNWKPDIVRRADAAVLNTQANPLQSLVQPAGEIWRNLIFNDRRKQIVVVDRLVKGDKHYAIVYVIQSEKKGLPFAITTSYDIFDRHNVQSLGDYLNHLLNISIKALEDTIR